MADDVKTVRVTATDIRAALLRHYAPPGHRVFFEVSNDTGFKASRWIDAVAVGIWPSTGHEIVGIEIKVSRGDWKRELVAPEKAQSLMRFCTRWCLACPEGLVKPEELPATWGMLTHQADGRMKMRVMPKPLEPEPITPGFMMAVLRQANGVDMELVSKLVAERVEAEQKRIEERVERGVANGTQKLHGQQKGAMQIAAKVKEICGDDVHLWDADPQAIAAAYKLVRDTGLHRLKGWGETLPNVIDQLDRAQRGLQAILDRPEFVAIRTPEKADA